eukprot:1182972-Prorocentrum_minimum.AAC.1
MTIIDYRDCRDVVECRPRSQGILLRMGLGGGSLEVGEEGEGVLERGDEGIHLLLGVVDVHRRARGRVHLQVGVQRLRAVVAATDGHAALVQDHGDVVGVDALHVEGAERSPPARRVRLGAEDAHPLHLRRVQTDIRHQFGH